MKTITYNKLVRDRIPEMIEASGKICTIEILLDNDYLKMLDAKLDEDLPWNPIRLEQRKGRI